MRATALGVVAGIAVIVAFAAGAWLGRTMPAGPAWILWEMYWYKGGGAPPEVAGSFPSGGHAACVAAARRRAMSWTTGSDSRHRRSEGGHDGERETVFGGDDSVRSYVCLPAGTRP